MRCRAVFFDAGETLVHPHPSFPELFAIILGREGHDVDPAAIRDGIHVVFERFTRAAEDGELWTTSPERSRAFWFSVYRAFLGQMGLPSDDGLPERLYKEFTDLSNYRLFPDAEPALRRLSRDGMTLGVISNFEEWLERLLESVYVGDNPAFDTEPAEALGMRGVLIDRRGRFPQHAGTRIASLEDLPAAIEAGG